MGPMPGGIRQKTSAAKRRLTMDIVTTCGTCNFFTPLKHDPTRPHHGTCHFLPVGPEGWPLCEEADRGCSCWDIKREPHP